MSRHVRRSSSNPAVLVARVVFLKAVQHLRLEHPNEHLRQVVLDAQHTGSDSGGTMPVGHVDRDRLKEDTSLEWPKSHSWNKQRVLSV